MTPQTISSQDKPADGAAKYITSCWRFPPFQVKSDNIIEAGDHPINVDSMEDEINLAISERQSYGQLVHATARSRPQAYMKWIIMKYAGILIESGDVYFRQGTLESLPLATQRYIEAAYVLDLEPEKVTKLGKRRTATYTSIDREATNFDLTLPFQFELAALPDAAAKNSPMPRYRFEVVLQRALGLCAELRPFGDRLLASIERKDTEELSLLTARHGKTIHAMMLDIKRTSLRMSQQEVLEMDFAETASTLNKVIVGMDVLSSGLAAGPTISANIAPFGVGTSVSAGGQNITAVYQAVSVAMRGVSASQSDQGQQASRKASLMRQLQERRLQANVRGREIKATDKQIEIQRIRIQASMSEINLQQLESENAQKMEAWYRTKYSNKDLYAWMEKNLRSLYFQAYTLAVGAALQAQAAVSFEIGKSLSILQTAGYWDASRDGLFAADNLFLDLKRMEQVYLDANKSDFEITKTISLRQINPLALMQLRLTGKADFSVSEFQYDMDFTGHYMRRIRSVASNINATLTLMDHSYRITADARTADDYKPKPSSFRKDGIPISSIAVSSGVHDAGVFELNFAGSQYLPFEGAGAISSWRLELPQEVQKFDYSTISDVMLDIQYTALDGGAVFASAANASVRQISRGNESKGAAEGDCGFFDLKNDFSHAWYGFSARLLTNKGKDELSQLQLGNIKERLPFFSRRQKTLNIQSVTLISKHAALTRTCNIKTIANSSGETGDALDEKKLGSHVMRTRSKVNKELSGDWILDASASAIEAKEQEIETMYLLVQYVFE
ncbi:hypothetical protein CC86DRAFT_456097 [Ophiobolus disseminans]|uniref:Tc toxin complex TcA C-terminal TcB-binding domain-containing protein n=1 Tax=Ophiobolus disseminans TaxID=1469910 RepID=A0A6A6ZYT4_9PLEO|nr:hypothetical protein CC86DRAFT_456097 [Ophiobolus disseminans]